MLGSMGAVAASIPGFCFTCKTTRIYIFFVSYSVETGYDVILIRTLPREAQRCKVPAESSSNRTQWFEVWMGRPFRRRKNKAPTPEHANTTSEQRKQDQTPTDGKQGHSETKQTRTGKHTGPKKKRARKEIHWNICAFLERVGMAKYNKIPTSSKQFQIGRWFGIG